MDENKTISVYQYSKDSMQRVMQLLDNITVSGYSQSQILCAIGDVLNHPISEEEITQNPN